MTAKTAELDLWLAKHEEKAKSAGESAFKAEDLEAAIVPADTLSKQALQAAAEDMAIEDTLYALERGLQAGILEPEAYLKQVGSTGPFSRSGLSTHTPGCHPGGAAIHLLRGLGLKVLA